MAADLLSSKQWQGGGTDQCGKWVQVNDESGDREESRNRLIYSLAQPMLRPFELPACLSLSIQSLTATLLVSTPAALQPALRADKPPACHPCISCCTSGCMHCASPRSCPFLLGCSPSGISSASMAVPSAVRKRSEQSRKCTPIWLAAKDLREEHEEGMHQQGCRSAATPAWLDSTLFSILRMPQRKLMSCVPAVSALRPAGWPCLPGALTAPQSQPVPHPAPMPT